MRKFYSMEKVGNEATINIFGDITSEAGKKDWFGDEIDGMSAKSLSRELEAIGEVSKINVYINSYGGEVAEGLAIYNALKRHKAKVVTHCDGFAASIASVIFMAGDERVMSESSLLMIHNAWTMAIGNSAELRKQADDLEKITQASVEAYKAHSTLSEKEIKKLMDNETWILPSEALEYGFATKIEEAESTAPSQNARQSFLRFIKGKAYEAHEDGAESEIPASESEMTEETETPETVEEVETVETVETAEEEAAKDTTNDNKAEQYLNGFINAILKI